MNCKKIQKKIDFILKTVKKSRPDLTVIPLRKIKLLPDLNLNDNLWTISQQSLDRISNPQAREAAEVILFTTVCFATAGIAVGSIGGPKGMAIGGMTGAVCGMLCSAIIVTKILEENGSIVVVRKFL